ncbi:MAG: alpha/beta hydrolase, partial [Sulfurimonas sp.]|nr:alpha/beta hydrolase [Sulfurimonas sp.]
VKFAQLLNNQIRDANGKEIHILCHSLGTAVVHDTLAKLYRKDANIIDKIPDLIPGAFNVNTLWTFANVSRMVNLLNGLENPMVSLVTTGPNGCTDYFFNIRHQLDPFTWFITYNRVMDASRTYENEIVRKWNTHSFTEYVSDPLVTKRILNTFTNRVKQNTPENLSACIAKHKDSTINEAVVQLTAAAQTFQKKPISSFKDSFDAIQAIMDSVKKLKEDLENENN